MVFNSIFMDMWRRRRVKHALLSAHFNRHMKPFTLRQAQVYGFQKSLCDECSKKWSLWNEFVHFQRGSKILTLRGRKSVSSSCHFSLVLLVERAKSCATYEPRRCNCHPCLGEDLKGSMKASLMYVPPWTPQSRASCVGLCLVFLNDVLVLNVWSDVFLIFCL